MSIWDKSKRPNKFSVMPEQYQFFIRKRSPWQKEAGKFSAENSWHILKKDGTIEQSLTNQNNNFYPFNNFIIYAYHNIAGEQNVVFPYQFVKYRNLKSKKEIIKAIY